MEAYNLLDLTKFLKNQIIQNYPLQSFIVITRITLSIRVPTILHLIKVLLIKVKHISKAQLLHHYILEDKVLTINNYLDLGTHKEEIFKRMNKQWSRNQNYLIILLMNQIKISQSIIKADRNYNINIKQMYLEIQFPIMYFISQRRIWICLEFLTLKEKLKRIKDEFLAVKLQIKIYKKQNRYNCFKGFCKIQKKMQYAI